jgi:MFS transporter, PAT family, beta-lactamase induction signal transducer AmpG
VMLARFVPPGVREPQFFVEEVQRRDAPLPTVQLVLSGVIGGVVLGVGSFALVALLAALKTMRERPAAGFDFGAAMSQVANPVGITDWVQLVGIFAFAVVGGLFMAAVTAARHGSAGELLTTQAATDLSA